MIPQLRDWHGKYGDQGLTIVGVHSPEFSWEKLVDKKGIVRFTHIGEGAYAEMEQRIQRLLLEP